jgi:hypothetical protein
MNERIKQLMGKATTIEEHGWGASYENFDREKFAKLIVAECLGIVDDAERGGSNDIWDNAVKFIRQDLREHFGVEE